MDSQNADGPYHHTGHLVQFRKRKIPLNVFTIFEDPIRAELFSAVHLEKYAETMAHKHIVYSAPTRGVNLAARVAENENILIESFQSIVATVREERSITPAAEWLIDNFYIVEEQLKDIRDHLPPEFYKELPKLSTVELQGYPRVYAIAWDFVAHTDSLFDPELLKLVLKSYQKIQPLTLGELWAISITLRVVMIENLRRLSARITGSQLARAEADHIADELLGLGGMTRRSDEEIIESLNHMPLRKAFAVQLVQRLRFQEGIVVSVLKWLDERLTSEGLIADKIVQEEHNSQIAANVTVRNIITSMRLMSSLDWRDFFEEVSLVDEKFQELPVYGQMDFFTRDNYRHSLEELARGSKLSELEVATALVNKIENERVRSAKDKISLNEKRFDLGFYLISTGRYEFEKEIHFKVKLRSHLMRWYVSYREFLYLGSILFLMLLFVSLCLKESIVLDQSIFYLLGFLGLFPASELAITIVNRLTIFSLNPRHLPRLDLSKSIPSDLKTFVVVPTMLVNEEDIACQVEQLEVHYLSNPDDSVFFALLSDWRDAPTEHLSDDELFLSIAIKQINYLNTKYGPSILGKNRFTIFHRYRKWNESEQKWLGWERKRGKLQEFNRFLRGATDTTFIISDELKLDIPKDITYVITLDADTKLPRGSVAQLVGTFAHPLNQPKFDTKLNRVIEGYGILQPRITPTLPAAVDSTFFQRLSSGPCGIDPYAAAVSDVYQDLFAEGSYTGKGIYNVDVFEQALKERTPENRLLSHDLFEGNFARCGLLSDVEFFEDFPSHFEVSVARNHRWIRGDWQLLPWILGREGRSISIIGRWKMIDNLRRSLLNPMIFILLILLFCNPGIDIVPWILLSLLSLALSHLLPFFEGILSYQKKIPLIIQLRSTTEDLLLGVSRFILNIIFIPYHSWVHFDAIFRTLLRLVVTKRHLLEWTTSAQSKSCANIDIKSYFKRMTGMQVVLICLVILIYCINSSHWAIFIPFFVLWLSSPVVAWRISLPPEKDKIIPLTNDDIFVLRNSARKIWRFFSTFVNEGENFLPPDNFQEDPHPIIAHRSSPTNFGLYLLSTISARDFGWIGLHEMIERLEATLQSMQSLPRYNGHFYNWYETTDKRALEPRYISSVDNGNLAGHLLAVAQSCEEMAGKNEEEIDYSSKILSGIHDSLRLLVEAFSEQSDFLISSVLNDLVKLLLTPYQTVPDKSAHWEILLSRSAFLLDEIKFYGGKKHDKENNEIHNWASIIEAEIKSHARDYFQFNSTSINSSKKLREKLIGLAVTSRELVYEMDFSFLYDSTRKLFSIGYRMSDSSLDASYYDLLASEARLLSLVAIAKGDVPAAHWFRLGRALTSIEKGTALISWSGSMFEYLMPSLVMNTPASSLLEQTCRLIVKKQIDYADGLSIPWGMSESAYNSRDLHLTYQYSNFGVPDLAFKRGIGKDLVIAPYATILAGMYDPISAVKNLKRLSALNAEGVYGFYESIDFTKSRIPEGRESAIVKTYMAHHQGMSLVSISNIIHDGLMPKRFHREPIIQSSELLLQERTPRNIVVAKTRAESVKVEHVNEGGENTIRQYFSPHHRVPRTHLLSNGHYSVMITTAGSGYSRFEELSLTRWREDVTRDNWGSYIYLRDIHSHDIWSAGFQPTCVEPSKYEVIFTEDRAKITREDKFVTSHLEIFVSPEENAEIRRLSLTNNGSEVKVIEVTTYSEVVLNTQGADIAHPTFSNLFVQTEYISEITSLLATRRPRSLTEAPVWMAQVISTDSNAIGEIEYETDRACFIGRGRTINNPISIEAKKLSNSVGSVLDPIISLRSRIRIEPGATATITYSTIMSSSREEIINLAEKFHEATSYERTSNLAWTDAQVKLHYLGIDHGEANLFQQLANRIIYLDSSLRVSSDILKRNERNATNLWAYGISGDYPIILVRIDNIEQRSLVRQLLRAHEYWGTKRLIVDLIILNEKVSSYSQELHDSLEAMVSGSTLTSGTYLPQSKGKIFLLRSDILPPEDRNLLQTAARAILVGRLGNLAEQVKRMIRKVEKSFTNLNVQTSLAEASEKPLFVPKLDFYNGFGGFTDQGLEYVIHLKKDECTPAPWINVIANTQFGFHVSESGAGSTWSMNSRENQLTPWSNDPISDPAGECFYIFDQDSEELWSPTISPIRVENAEYLIRHGQGYSQFELRHHGIKSTLTQFVHNNLPVKISKLVLKNESSAKRSLTITSYIEWVLGFSRTVSSTYLISDHDEKTGSLFSYNPWNQEFGSRCAFATFVGGNDSWTGNRTEFIGRNGNMKRPEALIRNIELSGSVGAGMDACAALKKNITINAFEEVTIIFLLGQTENQLKAQELIVEISKQNVNDHFNDVIGEWNNILGKIQVETPDLSMNLMLNRWLLYQTTVCRLWARSAFYQAGGAFGFRDQLQDSMAVIWTKPEMIRGQILRAASRQFHEGDVQHWWHMPTGRGVRTHFSDDLLWLPFVVSYYMRISEDFAVLEEEMSFLKGPLLTLEKEDSYYTPEISTEKGSVYEHCARAIDHSLLVGIHGLPLMGGGDWNDGMNRVGHGGKGESVWLAWFLISNLFEFAKIAESRGEEKRAANWRDHLTKLKSGIEDQAWDGDWYRRAFYDDGTPLGSAKDSECRIDSLAQTWGVISKAGDRERSIHAMESVEQNLIKNEEKMILLFTPPFNKTPHDPGYIKGYIPGVRENGGQYTHAAIWCILAYTGLDNGRRAVELFSMINPVNHSLTNIEAHRYKVEPYVIAADVYSEAPHVGRGGWTWYTGSAGWMYTTGIESILGFKLTGNKLKIDPRIHPEWKSYKITYRHLKTTYEIEVNNPLGLAFGVSKMSLDGKAVDEDKAFIELVDDGALHKVTVELI
ncbi:MAG: phosphorylase [Bacteriovorax sp.]|nr:phosphorylase [Bacteriovorax sp.]